MRLNFNALPVLIALAILVAVFWAISHKRTKERVELWLIAWALILLRSVVDFARFKVHWLAKLELAIGLCALELASVAFVVSVAPKATTWRRQLVLTLVLAVPALLYSNAMLWDLTTHSFYYAVIAVGLTAALALLWIWYRTFTVYVASIALASGGLAGLLVWGVATDKGEYGIHAIVAAMTFFAAGLYWYRFHRASAGVLATVFGFAAWGLSLPAALLLKGLAPSLRIDLEVWNIPKYLVAVGMIVTLLEDQILASDHLAYHDALTGLPNRRLLQDRLGQALARANRAGHKVAVLLLDLDDFKELNDTFGHRIGDAALQEVVGRLATRMRSSDTLARTGGDEFTVVSEVASAEGAQTLASALQSALAVPLKVEGKVVKTGISVGYSLYPDDATDPDELCAAADRAMYAAKRGVRSL
jgi:diguanylate cyclase (GGDEF)-like protein